MNILKSIFLPAFMVVLVNCSGNSNKEPASNKSVEAAAAIRFEKTEHDLGRILQDETVGYNFKFTNEGESALLILEAQAGCGCTDPRYSKKPIPPGESGEIEVIFDSSGRMGQQTKFVTIFTNARESKVELIIKADIYRSES